MYQDLLKYHLSTATLVNVYKFYLLFFNLEMNRSRICWEDNFNIENSVISVLDLLIRN